MNSKNQKTYVLSIISTISVIFTFFLLMVFPGIDDFSFYHMGTAQLIEYSGVVGVDYINVGFYIYTVISSLITNIPYENIPSFPFFLLQLIIVLFCILKTLRINPLICSSLIIIYITQNRTNYYGMFPHDVGLVILLVIILLVILRLSFPQKNQKSLSLLLMLMLITINFISYKHTFTSLALIIFFQIAEWFEKSKDSALLNGQKKGFQQLILIGIVFTFSFNYWIYGTFLPLIKSSSDFSSSSGIDKLLSAFFQDKYDLMAKYHFFSPVEIVYAHTMWLTLICINLGILVIWMTYKYTYKHEHKVIVPTIDKVLFSVGMASTFLLLMYSNFGTAEISLLVFTSIVGYGLMLQNNNVKLKNLSIVGVILLLVLSVYVNIESVHYNYYTDIKDKNQYEYIEYFSEWYIENRLYGCENTQNSLNSDSLYYTDYFTDSFIFKELAKKNSIGLHKNGILSRNQILFILSPESVETIANSSSTSQYIINYSEKRFVIFGWEAFKSWINFRNTINDNPYLSRIYSSGQIDVLVQRTR